MQTEQRIRDYERDLEQKLENEKRSLVASYERIRRTVEESEQERFDFELEKFRNEQNKLLDSKRVDIERLKVEKRKIQSEFNQELETLRREIDRRLENEKQEL